MGAISAFDFSDDLPLIKAPTLLIHGDQDLIIQHGNAALLAERIPDARFQIIPGAGHMFMWERPRETSDAVAAFLAGVKSPG
jgi:pimeloyl-ACP methyl ester carboxylesterase